MILRQKHTVAADSGAKKLSQLKIVEGDVCRHAGESQPNDHWKAARGLEHEVVQRHEALSHAECEQRSRFHQRHGGHGPGLRQSIWVRACVDQDWPPFGHISHHRLGEGGWVRDGVSSAPWIRFDHSQTPRGRIRTHHHLVGATGCPGSRLCGNEQGSKGLGLFDRRPSDATPLHTSHVRTSTRQQPCRIRFTHEDAGRQVQRAEEACASITRGGVGRKTKREGPRRALACTEAYSGRPVGVFLLDLSFVAHNPIQANLSRCWPGQYGELHLSVRGRRNNPPLWKTGAGAWDTPAASSLRGEGADRPWHRQMCRKVGRAVINRPFSAAQANTKEGPRRR